ncbi:insulinase family protein [Thalassomonas sp. M1454]|uniref:insulinase family protein n=1 Tax=Thalassomonas sp. M1454 TaxID=2594477 RepID=UPI00117E3370|nr:insulinase family protein [Thalassomonas sp. M1454]TRX57377.1 peptidase M16 [Thalassomonas sp. M1454]
MIQSPNDSKRYKPLTLENGLRVLLVENQGSNRSAASLVVNAGHFDDPIDRQGLAHFLEHMLFLGTHKYPESGEYQQYLSQHSGANNAWTGTEHTCFYFDINHQHLEHALDRFSQFFISPLLSQEFIEKERLNIDSEFKLKLKDDMRRIYDVHKETINLKHPFSKFSVGSIDTLADKENRCLKDEVNLFYQTYYCADRMTLAIEGPQPISELEQLVKDKFSAIKTSGAPKPAITEPLYNQENLGIQINIKPEKNDNKLILSFAMPGIDDVYKEKPITYLSYLIGHEGEGSILSYLKKRQWAMALTSGGGVNGSNFKDFNISIRLTEQGEDNIDEIISLVYAYIDLIKADGINEIYFSEKKAISEFSFQYQEKLKPIDSVNQLSVNMQHYPEQYYMYGDYVMGELNPTLMKQYLGYFSPTNMRVICINQHQDTDQTSFWYKVPYAVNKLADEQIKRWTSKPSFAELSLPKPNPYIVEKPRLVTPDNKPKKPARLLSKPGLNIWFKQDSSFFVPKGQIFIGIDSHVAIESKQNIAMTRLFVELFSDAVLEQNYHAELAGIHYHLYPHQGGMTLQLSGINEKQPLLLKNLLQSLKDHSLAVDRFHLFKKQLIRNWGNADKSKSISQLFAKLSALMKPYGPSGVELATALEKVSYEDFTNFCQQFFSHLCIEAFIYGNWLEQDAIEMAELINTELLDHIDASAKVNCAVTDYKNQGAKLIAQVLPAHDYASILYFPMETNDIATIAKTMVTSHLISPQFFHQMRTEKQYGYLVGVGYMPMNRFPGIAFYIQSPDSTPATLFEAMENFITSFDCVVAEAEWQHLQQGLIGQLQEKDTSPRIKSQRYWMSICNKDYNFNQKQQLIEAISALTLNDIQAFITSTLSDINTPDKICLASLKAESEITTLPQKYKIINDFAQFHQESQYKY